MLPQLETVHRLSSLEKAVVDMRSEMRRFGSNTEKLLCPGDRLLARIDTREGPSGDPEGRTIGFGIEEMWVWLPASGLVAAAFGVAVAPLATRLRGLYLAIVTLGLVFIGEHVFREWSDLTGGAGVDGAGAECVIAIFVRHRCVLSRTVAAGAATRSPSCSRPPS